MRTLHALGVAAALLCAATSSDARILAVANSEDGARIILYDRAGPCMGAAKMAEHIAADGEKVTGCWLLAEGSVMVSFLDGERGTIPVAHLKKPSEV